MGARPVVQTVRGQATSDGAGVRLTRMIGTRTLDHVDPFLLLDEFRSDDASDYLAGFPDHPHRGFETVTYMLAGEMEHRDHSGNQGRLTAGSVQWMTAGRGIIHSEMPKQRDGLMWGFQLWVNLPAKDKMCAPRYQDIPPERVPEVSWQGARVRVIAGRLGETEGPVRDIVTRPLYLDVALEGGGRIDVPLAGDQSGFAYVFEGAVTLPGVGGDATLARGELGLLGEGESVYATGGPGGGRFLLVAARPLREPIARMGPFVMNTRSELMQAVSDLQSGSFL
ncbi:MAG TPA: pirin family protein [Vicinamibacteria bacterium]|nr:pirin family protein [Vicinamibacteria bacterium]